MSRLTKFEDLEIPALTEVAKESFEEALWATEKALAKQLEFGRVMLIVKSKLPYGEWGKWVRETFEDHLSLRTIQTHMKAHEAVAQNPALLEFANSLDDILKATTKPLKPSVEVIQMASNVPTMEHDVVANNLPAKESATTKRSESQQQKPAERVPRHAGEHTESEVFAIGKADVAITQLKGIPEKNKFRNAALDRVQAWVDSQVSIEDRGPAICNRLVSMTAEERDKIFATVEHLLKRKPSQP